MSNLNLRPLSMLFKDFPEHGDFSPQNSTRATPAPANKGSVIYYL